ncbi:MAG TPA: HPP family protein [Hyphomicrobiales bacterium]|nr:HPP family protein [Hyphomicrobiales bacterium]
MSDRGISRRLRAFAGVEAGQFSHKERLISGFGGIVGIALVLLVASEFVDPHGAALIVASIGASAVLLFAAPHSPLAQPWALVGGHVVSALVGVTVARLVADPFLAGPLAVGLAITAMHYLRCLHPPGGASALTAVLGGEAVHSLGYLFVVEPVLLNALVILVVGVAFNAPFAWRRYPAAWRKAIAAEPPPAHGYPDIRHAEFVAALSELDTFVDVTEQDLLKIYSHFTRR